VGCCISHRSKYEPIASGTPEASGSLLHRALGSAVLGGRASSTSQILKAKLIQTKFSSSVRVSKDEDGNKIVNNFLILKTLDRGATAKVLLAVDIQANEYFVRIRTSKFRRAKYVVDFCNLVCVDRKLWSCATIFNLLD
jgi:hypothetical protein